MDHSPLEQEVVTLRAEIIRCETQKSELKTGLARYAGIVSERDKLKTEIATVTAQRDLLGKILSCQVKLNESEACLVYQDCYEALASLKGE